MRILTAGLATWVLAWQVGCALAPPIVLESTPGDLEQLVGTWEGRYTGARNGRSGNIAFELVAGEDHAHGDVLMIPDGAERGYMRYPGWPQDTYESLSQTLTIRFVRVQGGGINGSLDPYWDSDARCTTYATFRGSVHGNVMEGTFTSHCDNGALPIGGQWKVVRRS